MSSLHDNQSSTVPICLKAGELAQATGGSLVQGRKSQQADRLTTDSRDPLAEALFLALVGERFDGHDFCAKAAAQGARLLLVSHQAWHERLAKELAPYSEVAVVAVEDTLQALWDLARWHRNRHPARVVAITGSNGKTSTKEMCAAVLGGEPGVLYNKANLNNLIGMPRSLLGLEATHHHAVMEMGMNRPGEIARLAWVARPQVGLVTNVHPVHLEGLGSIEAVALAKGELFEALGEQATLVLNLDDPRVVAQAQRSKARRMGFGADPRADVRILDARQNAKGLKVRLSLQGQEISFGMPRPGLHNASNAAAAAAVGLVEGIAAEAIADRLARAPLPDLRLQQVPWQGAKLLLDCYNANPQSTLAALQTLSALAPENQAFAVLGDMKELGDQGPALHRQVGRRAAELSLAGLCTVGPLARSLAEAAREGGLAEVTSTEAIEDAVAWVRERAREGAWILIKGSRSMRLERVAEALLSNENQPGKQG